MTTIIPTDCELQLFQHSSNNTGTLIVIGRGTTRQINLIRDSDINTLSTKGTVLSFYFSVESHGIEAASKELANYINKKGGMYKHIVLIGFSSAGVMLYDVITKISPSLMESTHFTLISISTPFKGCPWANRHLAQIELGIIGNAVYNDVFPHYCSPIRDVAVFSSYLSRFNPNIEELEKKCTLVNIECEARSLWRAIFHFSARDIFMILLSKHHFMRDYGLSDGIVPRNHQYLPGVKNWYAIKTTHASAFSDSLEIIMKYIS